MKKKKKISFKKILSRTKEPPQTKELVEEKKVMDRKTETEKKETKTTEPKIVKPKETEKIETKTTEPKVAKPKETEKTEEIAETKSLISKPKETIATSAIKETTPQREEIMIMKAGNELYGISLSSVEEIRNEIKLTSTPQQSEFLSGIAEIRDLILPVVNLEKLFGIETENKQVGKTPVIVIEISGQFVGLQVSKIVEIIEIHKNEILPLPDIFPPKLFFRWLFL